MFNIGPNQIATGVIAFVTGFLLLCGFCWAIPMCTRPKNEIDELK